MVGLKAFSSCLEFGSFQPPVSRREGEFPANCDKNAFPRFTGATSRCTTGVRTIIPHPTNPSRALSEKTRTREDR
jgi:hypothetical protein